MLVSLFLFTPINVLFIQYVHTDNSAANRICLHSYTSL